MGPSSQEDKMISYFVISNWFQTRMESFNGIVCDVMMPVHLQLLVSVV